MVTRSSQWMLAYGYYANMTGRATAYTAPHDDARCPGRAAAARDAARRARGGPYRGTRPPRAPGRAPAHAHRSRRRGEDAAGAGDGGRAGGDVRRGRRLRGVG